MSYNFDALPTAWRHSQEFINDLFKLLNRARLILRDPNNSLKVRYGRLAFCAADIAALGQAWATVAQHLEATSWANTMPTETEDPVIVEDIKADGMSYWMQRLDDLEAEVQEATSRLRTARQAFEDTVSDLANANHKIKELEERLKGRI